MEVCVAHASLYISPAVKIYHDGEEESRSLRQADTGKVSWHELACFK